MIATLGIYGVAALLVALVGVAVLAAVWPDRSPLAVEALPLGVCALVVLLYLGAYPVRAPVATYVLLGAAVLVIAWWVWRRVSRPPPPTGVSRAPLLPGRADLLLLAGALGAGVLALVPVLQIGFPTTIAGTIADGWSYVSEITWLRDHGLADTIPAGTENPLVGVLKGQLKAGFGVGFELLGAAVVAVTGRAPFEMVNAVSALAFPLWAIGWTELWRTVRDGFARWARLAVLAAAASPLLVLPFSENQAPHVVGLALLPYALATALRFGRRSDARTLVVAAVACGGTLGVYTSLLPWLLVGVPAAVLAGRLTGPDPGGLATRLRGAALAVGALAVAVVVVAAIPVRQALRFIGAAGDGTGVVAPKLDGADQVVLATGAGVRYAFAGPQPTTWAAVVGAAVVVAAAGVAVASLVRRRNRAPARRIAWVLGGVVAATLVVVANYALRDASGYGVWKAIISGASLAGGLVVVALAPARAGAPWAPLRLAALAGLVVVWAGTSAALLQGTAAAGQQGFREPDVQMGRALDRLPAHSTLLVEGVDPGPTAFRMRMMAAYFGTDAADLVVEGVGTTPSYIAAGGQVEWRPARPWRWVLTSGPQVVTTPRRQVWRNGVYVLAEVPVLDVTPYGTGWYGVETLAGVEAAWTSGPVELVVSNRSARPRRAVLSLRATSNGVPRVARLTGGSATAAARIPYGGYGTIALHLTVPAHAVVPVTLSATPAATPAPAGDPRRLQLLVEDVRVRPG